MDMIAGMVAMIGAGVAAIPAGSPVVLEPDGKWVLQQGAQGCTLARAFGDAETPGKGAEAKGAGRVVVLWRPVPLNDKMQVTVKAPGAAKGLRRGVMQIALEPGGRGEASFEGSQAGKGERLMDGWVPAALFADLPERTVMTITPSHDRAAAVAMPGAKHAFAALAECNDGLARDWGVDPAEAAGIATPARPVAEREWFTPDDYPRAAIAQGAVGKVTILWTIGADGRMRDCRTVISSGWEPLDQAACAAVTKRARYLSPAIGSDGRPVVSHATRTIGWDLPDAWQDDAAFAEFMARRAGDSMVERLQQMMREREAARR